MYCLDCRALHRERSTDEVEDLPLCDKTEGKKCEVARSWIDHYGNRRTDPIKLYKCNHLSFELYDKTTSLSEVTLYEGKKKQGYFPSLSALQFVMENFMPENFGMDDMDKLLQKIMLIQRMKLEAFLQRLN